MNYRTDFIFILALIVSNITQAQNYIFTPSPQWVIENNIPDSSSVSKYEINSGYYLSLADYQLNLDLDMVYTREVINIVSYSGITNASQLSVVFDTTYQQLQIHHLYIWRDGKKIDRSNDMSLEIMHNEHVLQQGIYMGQVTAYDILNDIRKDDKIDFAYSIKGNNPIFDKGKYLFFPLETFNPIDKSTIRILYSKDKAYGYKCVDCDSADLLNLQSDDYKILEINQKDLKVMEYEDNLPSWLIPYKYFTLSSFLSWSNVNLWAQNVFALEQEPNLSHVLDEVFTGNEENTDQKIDKIINYVQDEIRYMGVESGIGSIKPYTPEQVVKQRFGDCKDKSLLLVHLLKKIGVDTAFPVLVNTTMQHKVASLFPSNQVLNHCIVNFQYNDSSYWIDPTISQQGGSFKNMYITNYGKALVIGETSDSLQNMQPQHSNYGTTVVDELTVESFTKPAQLKLSSIRKGHEADQRRMLLEYYSLKDLTKQVVKDLQDLFPMVNETQTVEINDNIESNTLTMNYNYEVDNFWVDGDLSSDARNHGYWTFKYEPLILYQYLNETICEERKHEYALPYPVNLKYSAVFNMPNDMLIYDENTKYENKAFYFEENYEQLSSKSFKVDYIFKTKSSYIEAGDFSKYCEQKNEIVKKLPIVLYFQK